MSRLGAKTRDQVVKRAKGVCEYCLSQMGFSPSIFSVDHIIPQSKNGSSELNNLALACQACNNFKYTRTEYMDPLNKEMVSLFHPRQQKWKDHFAWNEGCTKIIGKTAIGRATVRCLKLNRKNNVSLRSILFEAGVHLPSVG